MARPPPPSSTPPPPPLGFAFEPGPDGKLFLDDSEPGEAKKIVFVGPKGSGKTSCCHHLNDHFVIYGGDPTMLEGGGGAYAPFGRVFIDGHPVLVYDTVGTSCAEGNALLHTLRTHELAVVTVPLNEADDAMEFLEYVLDLSFRPELFVMFTQVQVGNEEHAEQVRELAESLPPTLRFGTAESLDPSAPARLEFSVDFWEWAIAHVKIARIADDSASDWSGSIIDPRDPPQHLAGSSRSSSDSPSEEE